MAKAGDFFIVEIKQAHMQWGIHRYTNTRDPRYGEGYLQIPAYHARRLSIYNSNHRSASTNYTCDSVDGFLKEVVLKAAGCSKGGSVIAKQFQGRGDLLMLGDWYQHVNAQVGDKVKVTFKTPRYIEIEKI
ncbi:hypothetical protein [Saccharibacillus brassicae]|uniref:Uncharacterized protein n=1 Tax=Saccharibacillus brassicae TaxID=2583377 RepID=A0A4Y6UWT5_SACBS|nr:hypothetical protein [Saccharibacillus brassicae]QDH22192.1 hypothetical protein FFV09_15875 [Saccharibacillus brassicae]